MLEKQFHLLHLLSIVSDTDFNKHLPVLLGTNVMEAYQLHLKEKFRVNCIQKASISTPWKLAFQCMNAQAKCSHQKLRQLLPFHQTVGTQ